MSAFDYVALNEKGREKKGTLEGDNARQVRQKLRDKGLVPISVEMTVDKAGGNKAAGFTFIRHGFNTAELSLITRQFATLSQAGLTIEESLGAVAKQTKRPKVRSILLAVRAKVVEGYTLAVAMSDFPGAFPQLYRATVAAGEQSGHLDLVLEELADYTESSHETGRKIKNALIYPAVLVIFCLLILVGLLRFVVPKIVEVFDGSGQTLPFLTRALIAASDFLGNYGGWLLLLILASILGFFQAMQREKFRYWIHSKVLKMPLFGTMSLGINAARVCSTLSILSASGVQLVDALKISGEVVSNLILRDSIIDASNRVREGSSLSHSLDQSGYFPPMMVQMIASGESGGELDKMLSRAARNQERELESLVSTLVSLFEPMMMIFMGGMVLTIVLAIMLPIISLNSLVG